nr:MAG TPA: Terminase large subunit [Caudoviricetes sp.]
MISAHEYIERFLKIKTKRGTLEPLKLNPAQEKYYAAIKQDFQAGKPMRYIILKARQMGFSTLTEAFLFYLTANQFYTGSLIIAHITESTNNLYGMFKTFLDNIPVQIRPMTRNQNAREITFENPTLDPIEKLQNPGLGSYIKVSTAGSDGVGRGSTIRNVHISEYAFWPANTKKEVLTGILQAVPNEPKTFVAIESTANGFDHFKELWDQAVAGESGFTPLFFAWYELPEYTIPYDGFELTEEEKQLQSAYNLTLDQLTWRRWCIKTNCSGDVDLFRQEYPSCPEEAFLMTGRPVFDNEKVMARIRELTDHKPERIGRFEYKTYINPRFGELIDDSSIKFVDDPRGEIVIYQSPIPLCPYVLGGDTAGDGSDYFTGHILDNTTGAQVARYREQKTDEGLYTAQMYCLGKWYNTALIGLEVNFSTYPVKELQRLRYPRQYVRESVDKITKDYADKYGFNTNSATRPVIVANLVTIMRESPELVNDLDTLREMLVFVKNDKGRPEAAEGEHDDLIMGLAIAHQIRPQQKMAYERPKEEKERRSGSYDSFLNFGRNG